MQVTGLDAVDATFHKTHLWLDEIMAELGWNERQRAYLALKGVLHSLRDRLPPDEAVQLGEQLPMLIRGLYYEGWKLAGKPLHERYREEFLMDAMLCFGESALARILASPHDDVTAMVRTVFRLLSRHTTAAESVRRALPAELRSLWPSD